ncbi:MAG: efflux RND transporter periplasmic adaptor subunit [Saprospiraceae bacterium]|nr:efflux RND transporter periplasmic adaptor subunit [Saprospiraceae bacterium]
MIYSIINTINSTTLSRFVSINLVVLTCIFSSCHSHKEGDNHNHDNPETSGEIEQETSQIEAPATIASLTAEQIKAVGITLGKVEKKQLTSTIKANGFLKVPNNNKGNVTSLYGGVIKTLKVQIGSYVKKGQVIATIANPQFIQIQEEFLTINTKITLAEQEMQRQKELYEGSAGAKKNLQNADAELKTLQTRRASLQQQIQLMGISPNNVSNANLQSALKVTSPIDGTVSNIIVKIGSYVDESTPIAEIVDNGALHLDLNVFEKDLPLLKVGQTIHFTLTNNPINEYDAQVFSIGSAFENESKTIPIHCNVKGNKIGLIDGMNISAIVSLDNVTTPSVPNDAIVEADGKCFIFIVTDKEPEVHHEDESETSHEHDDDHNPDDDDHQGNKLPTTNFEKIEVLKGVTNMGYTAITTITEIPKGAEIVTNGAFFINAKLSNTGGHEH